MANNVVKIYYVTRETFQSIPEHKIRRIFKNIRTQMIYYHKNEQALNDKWQLVSQLRWDFRSNKILTEEMIYRTLDNFDDKKRAALIDFLNDREDVLAQISHLATKSRTLRLQFVALGQESFNLIQTSPDQVDYFENEAQIIDLEALLK